jgi:hypothetical protein
VNESHVDKDAHAPAQGWRWVVQTLAMPVALVMLPLIYQSKQAEQADKARAEGARRDQADQKVRLYTELLSKREESDTLVRRQLFDRLMGSYLAPNSNDIRKRLVALDLLSLNFHESLNLSPLFWELAGDIAQLAPGAQRDEDQRYLDRVAQQVKTREASLLEVDGTRYKVDVDLDTDFQSTAKQTSHFSFPRVRDPGEVADANQPAQRAFDLVVLNHDPLKRAVQISVSSGGDAAKTFWVDPYDFPLVNFSRVSRNERYAVILSRYEPQNQFAELTLLYFPSWRSGAKDRPYLDELITQLQPAPASGTGASPSASAAASK